MSPGDMVRKESGYPFPGVLLSEFKKADGTVMSIVESVFHPGMVHIFPSSILSPFDGTMKDLIENHVDTVRRHFNGRM